MRLMSARQSGDNWNARDDKWDRKNGGRSVAHMMPISDSSLELAIPPIRTLSSGIYCSGCAPRHQAITSRNTFSVSRPSVMKVSLLTLVSFSQR